VHIIKGKDNREPGNPKLFIRDLRGEPSEKGYFERKKTLALESLPPPSFVGGALFVSPEPSIRPSGAGGGLLSEEMAKRI